MTVYGYWRCSTDIQDQERQIVALKKMQCSEIYGDHISGKSDFNARPQLTKCLNALKSGDIFFSPNWLLRASICSLLSI